MLAFVAEMLGHRRGVGRALHPQQRRRVRRRGDNDRSAAVFGTQNIFNKLFDLATAFANQADDDDIGLRIARHHPQQHAFANA